MARPTSTARLTRASDGRLASRPGTPAHTIAPGLHELGLDTDRERDALLYVPRGHSQTQPAPLALMLHGAGGSAEHGMSLVQPLADAEGLVVLAPPSRGRTWDVIIRAFGADVAFLDEALAFTFERCAIDTQRLAIGGFSDGASYALSIGLTNGDLFTHVIAFSPGFMAPASQVGAPRIFISHGTRDTVLPINQCSRRLVPALEHAGYDVKYHEFDGPHTIPPDIGREAIDWLVR